MASPSALVIRRFRFHVWISALSILILLVVAFFPPTFQFGAGVYLPVHTTMEVFSILVAALVFTISWNSNDETRAGTTSLLGCAFLAVALINFGHVLSFAGMPDVVTPASPEKAINFSLVTRFIAALALLVVVVVFWIGLYRSE